MIAVPVPVLIPSKSRDGTSMTPRRYLHAAALRLLPVHPLAWIFPPLDAEARKKLRASMVLRGYELQAGVDASIRRVEIEPQRISAPTLVLRGALDWPDVAVAAERFVRELPDAREVVIEGCAHLPTLERPDEVARLILEFLDTATDTLAA